MERVAAPLLALLLVSAAVAVVPSVTGAGVQSDAGADVQSAADADVMSGTVGSNPSDPAQTDGSAGVPPTFVHRSANVMFVDDPARTGQGETAPDVAAALSSRTAAVQRDHETRALVYRFGGLSDTESQASLVIAELIEAEDHVGALLTRQRRVLEAYADGEISSDELLRRLADVHQRAEVLERHVRELRSLSDRAGVDYLDTRFDNATALVNSLQGPIRDRVASRLSAGEAVPPVHVEVTDRAVVLATISDGRYVRESFFHDNLRSNGSFELATFNQASDRASEYYPWVFARAPSISQTLWDTVYRFDVVHPHGHLTTYLDARSGDVFRETQALTLSEVPTDEVRNVTAGDVRVVLNRTYRGGPLRVEVYDTASGERISGSVTLGNRTVGITGDDGVIWVVEPRDSYLLTVDAQGTSVSLNVSAG